MFWVVAGLVILGLYAMSRRPATEEELWNHARRDLKHNPPPPGDEMRDVVVDK